jgi:MoxR-like ATPase
VQSALLEVMAEHHVSLAGRTYPVPEPFLVLATQNPLESEGVYPLPEAQRDRFLMKVLVPYPSATEEQLIVERMGGLAPVPRRVLTPTELVRLQGVARQVHVDPAVAEYAVRLVRATRDPAAHGLAALEGRIACGASPRASIGLVAAGRALALLRGRGHLDPQDVFDVAFEVLNHRILLSYEALADGLDAVEVVRQVVSTVPAPMAVHHRAAG